MLKTKEQRRLDPVYVIIMAVIAALPFLLFRLIAPGSKAGTAAKIPAPTLAMSLSGEAASWAADTLAGLTLEQKIGQIITSDVTGGYIAEDDPRLARWLSLARDHLDDGLVVQDRGVDSRLDEIGICPFGIID